ncbi:MAG: nitronate monooxygenase [Planctomycetota bacterium]
MTTSTGDGSVVIPSLIQGGMGVAVSGWRLARAVAHAGQLGVVSGTALDLVLVRRLQKGDPDGDVRRALRALPLPGVADAILDRYFIDGGKAESQPFRGKPMIGLRPCRHVEDLMIAGSFVECWLAKEGHDRPIGINFLEKIQTPTIPSIYGAMLAGVDVVLVGAGIPRAIPPILDGLTAGRAVEMRVDVRTSDLDEEPMFRFDPQEYCGGVLPPVARPLFLAIVSSHVLATLLTVKLGLRIDGFVVEGPTAGGHNAPARGKQRCSTSGEPIYGKKDEPDLAVFRDLGRPFWLAGSFAAPEQLRRARAQGAAGIQVGTAFAYCEESGLADEIKARVLAASGAGAVRTKTDPIASPTGFPFKVVPLSGSLSEAGQYEARQRVCDLGYLRSAYRREGGDVGWRCPSEPVKDYVRKGGRVEDTVGRKCLCNALMSNVDLGQVTKGGTVENVLVTSGDDVATVARFLAPGAESYSAQSVIERLLSG